MSRPKPKILLRHTDKKTHKTEEILEAGAIFAVYFQGRPINLRTRHKLINYPGPKYKRTAFSSPGHAHNLADKMNDKYNTDEFTVVELLEGSVVIENDAQ